MSDYKNLSDEERFRKCFDSLEPIFKLGESMNLMNSEEVEMSAIWLEKPTIYNKETGRLTCRMAQGDQIRVEDGKIVRGTLEDATHRVIGCQGTINSSRLSITAVNLETLELEILKIK